MVCAGAFGAFRTWSFGVLGVLGFEGLRVFGGFWRVLEGLGALGLGFLGGFCTSRVLEGFGGAGVGFGGLGFGSSPARARIYPASLVSACGCGGGGGGAGDLL